MTKDVEANSVHEVNGYVVPEEETNGGIRVMLESDGGVVLEDEDLEETEEQWRLNRLHREQYLKQLPETEINYNVPHQVRLENNDKMSNPTLLFHDGM